MENIYWLTGRGNEKHLLLKTNIDNIYKAWSEYSIQTTGRMNEILAIDFAGGPTLVIGDSFQTYIIDSIKYIDKELFVTLK